MSFPVSRATSPAALPYRFTAQPDIEHSSRKTKENKGPDFFSAARVRRASTQSRANDKGKDPIRGKDSVDGSTSPTSSYDQEPITINYNASTSFTAYEARRPSTSDGSSKPFKKRGSILVAASDALGFRFGRRRPSIRQPPPMPMILPDVIEITAPRPDEEVEERERLRDMAAQSLGLGPVMLQQDTPLRGDSIDEEDRGATNSLGVRETGDGSTLDLTPIIGSRSPHGSSISVSLPSQPPAPRFRSRSILVHSRTNSASLAPIPPFPTTPAALTQFKQTSSTLPKFSPPSSLRIFALSRNWKSRFMVLSSPTTLVTRGSGPAVSYLHIFKTSAPDEKELERLEINEDSVVFVAEEEVGGRRHVVKVGGLDVGALRKDLNYEEGGRTMWLLQITDSAESQKWITTIKNAVLGQRTMRAGLGMPANTLGAIEPRGDMDVMLTMRAQGISSPAVTSPRTSHSTPPSTASQLERTYASSISSHSVRSQTTNSPKPAPSGAVSALKGMFTGSTRPRSSSRATSIESDRAQQERELNDDSFASMGSNLLNMLRSNDGPSSSLGHSRPTVTHAMLPFSGPVGGFTEHRLDRRIADRQPIHWSSTELTSNGGKDRANRTLSLGALSLQPPPRKRWTSIEPASTDHNAGIYRQVDGNTSGTGSFGQSPDIVEPPASPNLTGFSFGTPEQRPRAPSIQSVSTLASGENPLAPERSSSSTKRSSKRWSRQGVLPQRLTPPSASSVPQNQSGARLHPYAGADRPPSRTSSTHSENSQMSVVSSLPSFSKRASCSSARSVNTSSTTQSHPSHPVSRPSSSHRMSMPPPPRPAPTFALPPAPDQEPSRSDTTPAAKASFRDSMASRTFRRSLIAPKPPPSAVLPPRPDEPEYKTHHRRTSSAGGNTHIAQPDPISTFSLASSAHTVPPFPAPLGPLPPTPEIFRPVQAQAPPSRHTSLTHRLRILSAPSPPANPNLNGPRRSRPMTMTIPPTLPFATSPPTTPIAEKITQYQNDPSFLQLYTPVVPSVPLPPRPRTPPPEQLSELTSLSPPPRRGSKQYFTLEMETEGPKGVPEEKAYVEGEHKPLSLSRPGSVISLGIVSM